MRRFTTAHLLGAMTVCAVLISIAIGMSNTVTGSRFLIVFALSSIPTLLVAPAWVAAWLFSKRSTSWMVWSIALLFSVATAASLYVLFMGISVGWHPPSCLSLLREGLVLASVWNALWHAPVLAGRLVSWMILRYEASKKQDQDRHR